MFASDHRANARAALQGNWGVAVLVCFLANLIAGSGASVNVDISSNEPVQVTLPDALQVFLEQYLGIAVSVLLLVAGALLVVGLILGGIMLLGKANYFLKLLDRQEARVGDLFACFPRFVPAMLMHLLTTLAIVFGTLLLFVPGILATYGFAMAPYILLEDETCTATEALSRSWNMMRGHKWELFCLEISFFGWAILAACS